MAPYLTLMKEDAPQREHSLREVFNALRWIDAGCFEVLVSDMRGIIRAGQGRQEQPSAVVLDGRTLQSSCESGPRAGYDGYKRRKGSKVHMAVDTLGHLIDLTVTPANEQERSQVKPLCEAVQRATGETVAVVWADQGYTGEQAKEDAAAAGIELHVVKLPEAKKGFVLLPRRWVVERSFAWLARFRRLSRDFERMPEVLASLHFVVFAILMLPKAVMLLSAGQSSQHALTPTRGLTVKMRRFQTETRRFEAVGKTKSPLVAG